MGGGNEMMKEAERETEREREGGRERDRTVSLVLKVSAVARN